MSSRYFRPLCRERRHLKGDKRPARAVIVAVALLSAAATSVSAQSEWGVDATLTRLKPVGSNSRTAVSVLVAAQEQIGRVVPSLSGAATVAGDSVAAAQIGFGVLVLPPWTSRAPFEVGALVALYGLAAGDRGQSRALYAQQWLRTGLGSYWIGGAISQIDRISSFASNAVEIGARFVDGRTLFTLVGSTTSTNDREVFRFTGMPASEFAEKLRVADVSLSLAHERARFQFEARAGVRLAVEGLTGEQAFAMGAVGWRVRGNTSVLMTGGYQLADPLRGTPQWRFVAVGVRVSGSARTDNAESRVRRAPPIVAERVDSTTVRLVVNAPPNARTVEISGTFTDWSPVPLVSGADGWVATVRTSGGSHRVVIRVDGGEWRVPANLTAIEDEFGSRSGILIIPR